MTVNHHYCSVCQNTVEFKHDCPMAVKYCRYCELKNIKSIATKNRRGYDLCHNCYTSSVKAEIESDKQAEEYYKNHNSNINSMTNTQTHKLKNYKGVSYDNGAWVRKGNRWTVLSALIDRAYPDLTDADHAAIYALKDDPWEKMETLEDVIKEALHEWRVMEHKTTYYCFEYVTKAVSAWLAAQEPRYQVLSDGTVAPVLPEMTTDDHVKALKLSGWKELRGSDGLSEAFNELCKCSRIIILPTKESE